MPKKIKKNIYLLGVLQLSNYAIPLITALYFITKIGPEKYGIIGFCLAIISYFLVVTEFGFNYSGVQQVTLLKFDEAKLKKAVNGIYQAKMILLLGCFCAMWVLITLSDKLYQVSLILVLTFGTVVGQAITPAWLFQGLEELDAYSIISTIGKVLTLIFTFALVKGPDDFIYIPIVNSFFVIAVGCVLYLYAKKKYHLDFGRVDFINASRTLRSSTSYFFANVASSAYTITLTVLLGFIGDYKSVGIYSAADKIIQGSKGAFYPITQAIFPTSIMKFSQSFGDGFGFVKRVTIKLSVVCVFMGLIIFMFNEQIINIIYGYKYEGSSISLKVMAFVPLMVMLSNVFGVQILINIGGEKAFRNIIIFVAIASVPLSIYMIKHFEALGASLTTIIVETIIAISCMFTVYLIRVGEIKK